MENYLMLNGKRMMSQLEYIEDTGTQWIDTGYVPTGDYVPPERKLDLSAFLRAHKARVDENNRITLEVLCDGTLFFLSEMVAVLKAIECTDIKYDGNTVSEGIPKEKPWCNYLYTASGVLPDNIIYFDGMLYVKED